MNSKITDDLTNSASVLESKIKKFEAKLGIIGLGYVGLPLTKEFAEKGFDVLGFNIDESKIQKLNRGESYINYIPSDVILSLTRSDRFNPTSDFSKLALADVIVICLPTPLNQNREPDLSSVINITKSIAKYLRRGQLIVLESTTYPGTTEEEVLPFLESTGLKVGRDFFLAYSPEREDPGNKDVPLTEIPKVVSGVTEHCLHLATLLYGQVFTRTVTVNSPKIAEATKLLENVYRAVNIALVNELKIIFDRMGINIWEVIEAASTKPFGFTPFYPGPGLGGHCIPIDPFYLAWKAKSYEVPTRFIELAGEINTNMPNYVIGNIIEGLNRHKKSINGSRILILGMAYKKDVNDTRESPSLKIISLLKEMGAILEYNDPYVSSVSGFRHYPDLKMNSISIEEDSLESFDCVVIVTDHSRYDWEVIVNKSQLVIDTRNALKYNISNKDKIIKA